MLQKKWYSLNKNEFDDMATHVAAIKDLVCRLTALEEPVPDGMIVTKILLTLPPFFKYFATAWESTAQHQHTLTSLISRLSMEETRANEGERESNNAFSAKNTSTTGSWTPERVNTYRRGVTGS